MNYHLKNIIQSELLWKYPIKEADTIPESEYEVLKKIVVNNTVYVVKISEGLRYFRILEDTPESKASICRSLATDKIWDLLGLDKYHPKSKVALLDGFGIGILQEPADGISIMPYTKEQRYCMLSPDFQRVLLNTNLLDAICHEADHSPNNYNVTIDKSNRLLCISCFDNNGKGTFACSRNASFTTYKGVSPFLLTDGTINRPHLSKEIAERIEDISFFEVYNCLRKYLKICPIAFLYHRLRSVRKAIHKTSKENPSFLLKKSEWTNETIKEELGGKYGKTYMIAFLNDCLPHNQ